MKIRNKINKNKISITRKIMLLYACLFSLTIVSISCILLITAKDMGIGITFTALNSCYENIENSIKSDRSICERDIKTSIGDNNVYYIIENNTDNEVYVSTVFLPQNKSTLKSIPRDELPDNIEEGFNFKIKSSGRAQSKKNNSDNKDYVIYTNDGVEFMCIEKSLESDGKLYTIKLFKSTINNTYFVQYIGKRLLYVDIIGILIACLIGAYISYVLLKPVKKIRETAARISVEDLSQRIEITGPNDEIKELSVTFNSMIDRLEKSFEQQSRFVSDASHELRTPISVINGYANLINRWGKDDPEILQEAVNNILEETDHMSVMIKNLLFLAKSDQNRNVVNKRPMSLNEAVIDIAKDLSVTNDKIKVITDICDMDIVINGDPDLIKQMLWIYTENAVKYSGDNKEITYKLYLEDNYVCVSVKDNGFGISDEEIPHLFERFYRVDKSRNKEIPGNGLGLSIAKWIIDIHSGKVEVKSKLGEGTEFINKFKIEAV